MSDHHLKFKGPGFDFDAKGWLAILAAILIVVLLLLEQIPADVGHRLYPAWRK